jgi:hypothetical protein
MSGLETVLKNVHAFDNPASGRSSLLSLCTFVTQNLKIGVGQGDFWGVLGRQGLQNGLILYKFHYIF